MLTVASKNWMTRLKMWRKVFDKKEAMPKKNGGSGLGRNRSGDRKRNP